MERGSAAVLWYRRDLRTTDHEALHEASKANFDYLVPAYFLDPSDLKPRWKDAGLSVSKLGPHRCRFLLQSLQELRTDLQSKGSDLVFQLTPPDMGMESLIQKVVQVTNCQCIELLYHLDVLPESIAVENKVRAAFKAAADKLGITSQVRSYWSLTLYHPDDLPYNAFKSPKGPKSGTPPERELVWNAAERYSSLPPVMTQFRKAVQSISPVRSCFPEPNSLPAFYHTLDTKPDGDFGVIPTSEEALYRQAGAEVYLENLREWTGVSTLGKQNADNVDHDPRTAFPFKGGTKAGVARLRYYLWGQEQGSAQGLAATTPALEYFKNTRMQAVGVDSSTKLSPFMALGCLSPRMVYQEVLSLQAAAEAASNPEAQCQWLIMHLCIRDFFIYTAMKEGNTVMTDNGIKGEPIPWSHDLDAFQRWASGRTGLPFVDACMRELAGTGYMSNRGRQNVASFLTKSLLVDWKLGAELFESLLLDHDVAVNYCNWNYFAGIGNDPRNRQFKTVTQGMKYDADAQLITAWVPELKALPVGLRHQPFNVSSDDAKQHGFDLAFQYVEPLVDPKTQIGVGPKE